MITSNINPQSNQKLTTTYFQSSIAMKYSALIFPLFLLFLLLVPFHITSLTCSDVVKDIRPCVSYLKGAGGKPPSTCCDGAKALASAASGTANMKIACNCLKSASKSINVNPSLAKALPGNCGINLGFSFDPNLDCSSIG